MSNTEDPLTRPVDETRYLGEDLLAYVAYEVMPNLYACPFGWVVAEEASRGNRVQLNDV